jgi:hypothetical protein
MAMKKQLLILVVFLIWTQSSWAQLSGIKTIPGDYPTIAAAVTALNGAGVGSGGVTFNVAAGHTETVAAPISLTATGTLANPITFQKSGAGANPLITAYLGTATPSSAVQDGIWNFVGSDYTTIDGIDLLDPNTTNPGTMEYGFAFFRASATDGCQNNIIRNCVVTLSRVNNDAGAGPSFEGSKAINVVNATVAAQATALTPTSAAGTNSFNKFYGNTLQQCNYGIVLNGHADVSPFTLGDTGNDIGGVALSTGNTILNFGGAAAAINPAAAIRINNQWGANISYNTIDNNNGSGANHPNVLRGIYAQAGTSASVTINNNNLNIKGGGTTHLVYMIENAIGSTAAGNTVNINNNTLTGSYLTATSGTLYGIWSSASAATVNINNNTVQNIAYSDAALAGSGIIYGIFNSGLATTVNTNQNLVNNITRTGTTGGTTIGVYISSGVNQNANGNTITNMSIDGTGTSSTMYGIQTSGSTGAVIVANNNLIHSLSCLKTTGSGTLYGMYNISSPPNETYNNNIIRNLTHNGTGTMYGLYAFTTSGTRTVANNLIHSLTTGGTTISGIQMSSSSPTIHTNKVYNIQSTSTGAPTVSGIAITSMGSPGAANVYNNLIGDLKAPAASSSSATAPTLRGINLTTTSTGPVNLSYNTIHLNGSTTGANFATCGVFATTSATATAAELFMRNNIIVNKSTPAGIGFTVAYQRSSTTFTNYNNASNNNLFFAGTPGATRLIYYDGTNASQSLGAFKGLVTPRESSSITEDPPFKSIAGASADFLHINELIATQLESAGIPIAGITVDYDGNTRHTTMPDIGADEFAGILLDLSPPNIVYTPLGNTSGTGVRTLTASITDASNVPTSGIGLPRLFWRINAGAYTAVTGVHVSGSNYTFNFGAGVAVNDVVSYYIAAQDIAPTPNVGVFPAAGAAGLSANPPAAATPPTNPSSYLITGPPLSGSYTVGLALFNNLSGKNITFEKQVKKVLKEVDVEVPAEKGEFAHATQTAPFPKSIKRMMEIEEVSWIPMENGREYKGDLFVSYSGNDETQNREANSGVYATITAAVTDLNNRGVSGPVTFLLTDATYPTETFPIVISVSSSAKPSSTAPVLIRPANAVTTTISAAVASGFLFRIQENFITIDGSNSGGTTRNLTIENTSATGPQVLLIASTGTVPVTNVTVRNCNLINGANTNSAVIVSDAVTPGNPGYFNNITLRNNTVQKAYIGIYCNAFVAAGNGSGLLITQNDLTTAGTNSVRYTGIYIQGVDGAAVSQNKVANFDGVTSEDDRGIWFATSTVNSRMDANEIYALGYTGTGGYGGFAVAVSSGVTNSNNIIANNVIYNIFGDGWGTSILADNPMGMYLFGTQTGAKVYHNSIHLYGSTLNRASAVSIGIALGTGTTADLKNNIIVNNLDRLTTLGLAAYGIYLQTANTQLEASNYNDIFVNPTSGMDKIVGQVATTSYTTLANWQTGTGFDMNSFSVNPQYTSNTNLLPTNMTLNNAGLYQSSVPMDYNLVMRTSPPDIGAIEFGVNPIVTTTPVSNLACGNVTLNGTVNASGFTANTFFDYGTTMSFGTTVAGTPASVSGSTLTNITTNLTGLTLGTTYYYRLRVVTTGGLTAFGMTQSFTTNDVAAPTATTLPAAPVGNDNATLNGTVNANCSSTTVTFEWGTTIAYGNTINAAQSPVSGGTNVAVSADLIGLALSQTYNYRVVASNANGTTYGANQTFTTGAAPPTVVTLAASNIDLTVARLNSTVNANNQSTTTSFEWGLTPAYGNVIAGVPLTVTGTTNTAVYADLTGLSINTTYYYRAVGQNSTGTAYGAMEVFTTLCPIPVPTITGADVACQGDNKTYTTETGNQDYVWTVSAGGQILSGQGTHSITVKWNSVGDQNVTVIYANTYGCSAVAPTELDVYVSARPVPTIAGNTAACQLSDENHVFTTEEGFNDYVWTVTSGGTIVSGQGTYQLLVYWTGSGTQTVTVNYENASGCEGSTPGTFAVNVLPLPAAAGNISGTALVCLPSGNLVYSVAPIANAEMYYWTVPYGVTIVDGIGTNSITVSFAPDAEDGVFSVYATNGCGAGAPSSNFAVSIGVKPAKPIVTLNEYDLSSNAPEGNQWYFEGEAIDGATGQTYTATETGNYWTVVTIDGCSSDPSEPVYVLVTGLNENAGGRFTIHPVPNDGRFSVTIKSNREESWDVTVYNSLGVQVYQIRDFRVNGSATEQISLQNPTRGTYTVVFSNNKEQVIRKVLVSN